MGKNKILILLLIFKALYIFGVDKIDIKIGFVGPLSGNLAEYGTPQLEAIQLSSLKYKDHFNIEIISIDDEGDPQRSQDAAQELLDQNVDYVIGHVTSAATSAALQIYNNRTLILNPSSTNPFINNNMIYNTFIRTIPNDFSQSEKILDYITQNKFKNICVIYEYNGYSQNILSGMSNFQGDAIFQYLILDLSNGQLYEDRSNTERIDEFIVDTDLIIYLGYYKDFINIYSFIRNDLDYTGKILGSDGVHHSGLFEESDINFENMYTLDASGLEENEAIESLINEYQNENSCEPGTYFTRTYVTNDMILNYLLKNSELFTLSKEAKALRIASDFKSNPQESLIGDLYFNDMGDIIKDEYRLYQIVNNEFIEIR